MRLGDDEGALRCLGWSRPARRPTRYRLRPHNPASPTLEVAPGDPRVDGVYRGLLRSDVLRDLLVDGGASTG